MNKKAMFYEKENNKIRCLLCPHFCLLKENQTGICNVRKVLKDENGLLELYSLNYGEITSIAVDPIEKNLYIIFTLIHKFYQLGLLDVILNAAFVKIIVLHIIKLIRNFVQVKVLLIYYLSILKALV